MKKTLLLPLMLCMASTAAVAQNETITLNTDTATDSATAIAVEQAVLAKQAAVEQLFVTIGVEQQMHDAFEPMIQAMWPSFEQMAQQVNLDQQGVQELQGVLRDWFQQDLDLASIIEQIKQQYVSAFTVEELQLNLFTQEESQNQLTIKRGEEIPFTSIKNHGISLLNLFTF